MGASMAEPIAENTTPAPPPTDVIETAGNLTADRLTGNQLLNSQLVLSTDDLPESDDEEDDEGEEEEFNALYDDPHDEYGLYDKPAVNKTNGADNTKGDTPIANADVEQVQDDDEYEYYDEEYEYEEEQ